ncbi:hypothetical protein GTR04_3315 [Trichophyton interdigitale]|uniref:Uncharacterized protein n=1 Tax=Trichophyton interdigitale TaxID=101480 RepID=A0A9P5CZC8_9EURO|nr:hypothetical protein GY631_3173 [Trichophyton interdigitale]KAF3896451.1 hypothetical protein GY632_2813 [Trichophyton interdigitale]KAG8209320.1 hypothetical protein GTR04_3315 [Trichophyton interdigitale]
MELPLSSTSGVDGVAGDREKHEKITCYSYDSKREYPNYVKCPDSDSCCETIEQCRPDRLCTSNEDPKTLIRAPCAYKPWTNSCAQVCLYDNNDSPVLPRAVVCEQTGPSSGSYCCDDNRTCCIDRAGFFLDENGLLIGRANETDNSTLSPKPIGVSVTALRSMGSASATSTPARSPVKDNTGLSTVDKAGIGVGVGVAVLLAIIAGALLFLRNQRRKRRTRADSASTGGNNSTGPGTANTDAPTDTWEDDKEPLPGDQQRREKEEERAYELMGDGGTPELESVESPRHEAPSSELPVVRVRQTEPIELPADQPTGKPRRS